MSCSPLSIYESTSMSCFTSGVSHTFTLCPPVTERPAEVSARIMPCGEAFSFLRVSMQISPGSTRRTAPISTS